MLYNNINVHNYFDSHNNDIGVHNTDSNLEYNDKFEILILTLIIMILEFIIQTQISIMMINSRS